MTFIEICIAICYFLYLLFIIIGLYSGAMCGFLMGCWLSIGQFITKPKYQKLPVSTDGCFNLTTPISFKSSNVASNLSGSDKIYSISYMWLSPIGVLTTIIIGVLVSLITNKFVARFRAGKVDDSLLLYRFLFFKKKTVTI